MQHQQKWLGLDTWLLTEGEKGSVQLTIYHEPQGDFRVSAYIKQLWVETGHRRQGVGTRLMDRAERIARELGRDSVFLEWHPEEAAKHALQMYRSRGYLTVSKNPDGCCLLRKELKQDGAKRRH